jgi:RHS repeat-associated protein
VSVTRTFCANNPPDAKIWCPGKNQTAGTKTIPVRSPITKHRSEPPHSDPGCLTAYRAAQLLSSALILAAPAPEIRAGTITTTVFVGPHFEVRDHEQPTKYVFDGPTRVASIKGSLSPNQRVQRLRLYAGWNLISLAVKAVDLPGQIERSAPGMVSSIYLWSPGEAKFSIVEGDRAVPAGSVLWMEALASVRVGLLGDYSEPAERQLETGAAFLSSAGLETLRFAVSEDLTAWNYQGGSGAWQEHLGGDLGSAEATPITVAPGAAVFVRATAARPLSPPDPALRLTYYHADLIGSPSAVTDDSGGILEETSFYPFGVPRRQTETDGFHDPYEFAQKERDRETGSHYFEARYLAAGLPGFLTPDGKYANPDKFAAEELQSLLASPQEFGLYAYVRGNPLRWTDPTGLDPGDAFKTADDAAIDALRGINATSIKENTEYAGVVYYVPGEKLFYAGKPHAGNFQHSYWDTKELPDGAKLVGDYHTHANYSQKVVTQAGVFHIPTSDPKRDDFNSDFFSNDDQDAQLVITGGSGRKLNFEPIPDFVKYLGTPRGHFWKLEGNRYPGSFTDLSKDANDKFIDWVAHPPTPVRSAILKNFYPARNPWM